MRLYFFSALGMMIPLDKSGYKQSAFTAYLN
jgi:hypothetical protein